MDVVGTGSVIFQLGRSCAAQVSSSELNENATSVSTRLHKDSKASLQIEIRQLFSSVI